MELLRDLWQAELPLRCNGFQLQSKRHFAHDPTGDARTESDTHSHVSH